MSLDENPWIPCGLAARIQTVLMGIGQGIAIKLLLVVVLVAMVQSFAFAGNSGITYHARIIRPDEVPLEGKEVQFRLQIRTPGAENCLLFEETQTHDLRNTGGVVAITINDGSGVRTDGGSYNFDQIFANRVAFTFPSSKCSSGNGSTTWTPNDADGRKFHVLFREDSSRPWEPLPATQMNFVPMAIESKQIGGYTASNLLRVADGGGPQAAPVLSPTQATELVTLTNGASTLYTKAGQLNGVAIPTSYAANESIRWNGTAWVTYTTLAAADVQAFAKTTLPTCAAGEILTSDGTTLGCVTDGAGAIGDATTSTKGLVTIDAAGGIAVSGGTISLAASGVAAGTYTKVAVDATGRAITGATLVAADIPSLDAAKITTGTFTASQIPSLDAAKVTTGTFTTPGMVSGSAITSGTIGGSAAMVTTGAVSANSLSSKSIYVWDSDNTNSVQIVTPSTATLTTDYVLTLPADDGNAGQVLSTDGSGALSWVTGNSGSVTSVSVSMPAIFSVTGGPITSSGTIAATLASQSANSVFAAPDGSSGTPTFRSLASGDIPSLDAAKIATGTFTAAQIPSLDASKVTTGTFAQSLIPALSAAQIPNLDASKITTGTFTTGLIPDLDAAKITTGTLNVARIPDLDAAKTTAGTFAVARIPALDASNVPTGTFAASQIPTLDASKITSGTLSVPLNTTGMVGSRSLQVFDSDSTNKVTIQTPATGSLTSDYALTLPVDDGTSGQVLTTDGSGVLTWSSAAIGSVTSVDVNLPSIFTMAGGPITAAGTISATLASQAANSFWAAPNGSAGAPTFRAMVAADVPALDAAKITTGTLATGLIPDLDAAKITTGTLNVARIPDLDAAKIATGTLSVARIPDLDAAKITTGTLIVARIPDLDAAKTTTGTFAVARIPALDASNVPTGTFAASQIPALDASKIGTGTITNTVNNTTSVGTRSIEVFDSDSTNKVSIVTPATGLLTADYTLTLPVDDGTNGQVLTTNGSGALTWSSAAIGSVTSVDVNLPSIFTMSGGPITAAGTISATLASQAANSFWAAPNGSAGAPTFRAMVAADVPALDAAKITTGTFTAAQIPDLDSAKIATGTLNVARIPDLDAAKITTGTFTAAQIPALDASKTTTGTFAAALIPNLDGSKVNSGTVTAAVDNTSLVGTRTVRVYDSDSTNNITFQAPATGTLTSNYVLTLPADDGAANQVLQTDGSGNLTWVAQTSTGSGTFRADNGTAAVPTHSFTADSNSGMYSIVDDVLGFSTGGTNRMTVNASGFVGIGTTAPGQALSVAGNVSAYNFYSNSGTAAAINFGSNGAGMYVPAANTLGFSTNASARMTIDASGNIGVGTTAPVSTFDVTGHVNATGYYRQGGANVLTRNNNVTNILSTGGVGLVPDATNIALFASSTGNVAIGSTVPSTKLDVAGVITANAQGTNASQGGELRFQELAANGANYAALRVPDALAANYTLTLPVDDGTANQVLQTDGNGVLTWTAMTSTGSGTYRADNGTAAVPTFSFAADTNSGMYSIVDDVVGFSSGGTNRMAIGTTGIGIGTTAPGSLLDVTNNANSMTTVGVNNSSNTGAAGSQVSVISTGGTLQLQSTSSASGGLANLMYNGPTIRTTVSNASGYLSYFTGGSSAANERMRIDSSGNMGVGTTAPGTKLDVAGVITANVQGTSANQGGEMRFQELAANGANYAALRVPDALAANYTLTLPVDDGTANQVLQTDGNGVLTWVAQTSTGSGTFRADNGTAAIPTFSFAGDTNTGMYSAGADILGFSTNGTNRVIINAAGNVGVGTASPNAALDVTGDIRLTGAAASTSQIDRSANDGALILYGGIATNAQPRFALYGSTHATQPQYATISSDVFLIRDISNTTKVTVNSAGQMGIGSANPATLLDVAGAITANAQGTNANQGGEMRFREIAANGSHYAALRVPDALAANYTLTLPADDGTANQVLQTDGNGVLTWVAQTSTGSGTFRADNGTAAIPTFSFTGDTNTGMYNVAADMLGFSTNNTNRLTIDSSGNVGIGTTAPTNNLDVVGGIRYTSQLTADVGSGTAGGQGFLAMRTSAGNSRWRIGLLTAESGANTGSDFVLMSHQDNSTALGTPFVIQRSTGNVGIGTTAAVTKLDVAGAITANAQGTAANQGGEMRFQELAANGSHYAALRVPDALAASYTLTLPVDDGTANQYLQTDGNGVLTWATVSAGSSGTFRADNGTAAVPTHSFTADTNSGMYSIVDDVIGFSTGGTNRMAINANGYVGIGTTAPSTPLHVNGTIKAVVIEGVTSGSNSILFENNQFDANGLRVNAQDSLNLLFDNDNNGTGTVNIRKGSTNAGAGTSILLINNAGNVGIGTTTPVTKLDVSGSIRATSVGGGSVAGIQSYSGSPGISLGNSSQAADEKWWDFWSSGKSLYFRTVDDANSSSSTYMQVTRSAGTTIGSVLFPTGTVGIGTTDPKTTLDVNGSIKVGSGACGANTQGSIQFSGGNIQFCNTSNVWTTLAAGTPSQWTTNGSAVGYTGPVGIGTTSPLALELHVADPSGTTSQIKLTNNTGSTAGDGIDLQMTNNDFWIANNESGRIDFQTTGTNRLTILPSGNVGIGTTNPGYSLAVAGAITSVGTASPLSGAMLRSDSSNGYLDLYNGGTVYTRIMSSSNSFFMGSLGIGTTAPTSSFDVRGAITANVQGTATGQGGEVRFQELAAGGSNYVALRAPDALGSNITLTLPTSAGTLNQVLTTDGSGALSWTTPAASSSGTFLANNGTAAAPTFSFTGDTNTGMYNVAADTLGFSTNGSNRIVVDPSGNVGIGITSPSSRLSVQNSGANVTGFTVGSAASSDATIFLRRTVATPAQNDYGALLGFGDQFGTEHLGAGIAVKQTTADDDQTGLAFLVHPSTSTNSGLAEALLIDHSGNVGIGTTAPAGRLDVKGTFGSHLVLGDVSQAGTIGFRRGSDGANTTSIGYDSAAAANTFSFKNTSGGGNFIYSLNVGGSSQQEVMRIDNSGNVGIGTTAPGTLLDVRGIITANVQGTSASQGGEMRFQELAANGAHYAAFRVPDALAASYTLTLPVDDGTANQVLQTDGNGVLTWVAQTSTSSGTFRADNGTAAIPTFSFTADTNSGMYSIVDDVVGFSTGGTNRMAINASGNIGIGTTAPSERLTIGSYTNNADTFMNIRTQGSGAAKKSGLKLRAFDDNYGFDIIHDDGSSPVGLNIIRHENSAAGASALFINRLNGNVGIGTTAPATTLDVNGSVKIGTGTCGASTQGSLQFSSGKVQFCNTSNVWTDLASGIGSQWVTNGSDIGYTTGKVGIGTTSPVSALSVVRNGPSANVASLQNTAVNGWTSFDMYDDGGNLKFGFGYGNTGAAAWAGSAYFDVQSTTPFLIAQNAVRKFEINSSGDMLLNPTAGSVGIGTTAPAGRLDVSSPSGDTKLYITADPGNVGTEADSPFLIFRQDGGYEEAGIFLSDGASGNLFNISVSDAGTPNTGLAFRTNNVDNGFEAAPIRMFINTSGKVGIGTTAMTAKLHVAGAIASNETTTTVAAGATHPGSGGVDMSGGNVFTFSTGSAGACPTIKLDFATMVSGGAYTIVLSGYNSGTCTFTDAAGATSAFRYYGGAAPTLSAAGDVVCTMTRANSKVYTSCLIF